MGLLALGTAASATAAPPAAAAPTNTPLRVLFIGNSYTACNSLHEIFRQLALEGTAHRPVSVETVLIGGATLKSHWENGGALKRIEEARWDYVVLQAYTMPFSDPDGFIQYAVLFGDAIRKAGAKPVQFMPWASKGASQLQARLNQAYSRLFRKTGDIIAPAGAAWQIALKSDPAITLHYVKDGSHPNYKGSYLAACVIYAAMMSKSPQGLKPMELRDSENGGKAMLQESEAAAFQQIAWESLQAFKEYMQDEEPEAAIKKN